MIQEIPSVRRILQARGYFPLPADLSVTPETLLLRFFEEEYPVRVSFSAGGKEYFTALADCLSAMDERLYHEYRPMLDLLRRFMLEAAPSADPEDSDWKDALLRAAALGAVDSDNLICRPHKNDAGGSET